MNEKSERNEIESKYIQQHLANERTFLAWIRTAGAIMGIGFLATSYHFRGIGQSQTSSDKIALFIGVFSIFLGILTICFGLYSYLNKRAGINSQTFRSSGKMLVIVAVFMLFLTILYFIYLLCIY